MPRKKTHKIWYQIDPRIVEVPIGGGVLGRLVPLLGSSINYVTLKGGGVRPSIIIPFSVIKVNQNFDQTCYMGVGVSEMAHFGVTLFMDSSFKSVSDHNILKYCIKPVNHTINDQMVTGFCR